MSNNDLYIRSGRITLDGAKKLADAARQEAEKRNLPGALAVVDDGCNLVYLERWDGTMPYASRIAISKASSAVGFGRPTHKIEEAIAGGRTSMLSLTHTVDYAALKGGYPIVAGGMIVGGMAVAGALTGENDELLARAALKILEEGK
jgi:glc operon protein GlcG